MQKRHICKNAIIKHGGLSSERIKELLINRQYPNGSTLVRKEDLVDMGNIIDKDYEVAGIKRTKRQFPKFDKPLF